MNIFPLVRKDKGDQFALLLGFRTLEDALVTSGLYSVVAWIAGSESHSFLADRSGDGCEVHG